MNELSLFSGVGGGVLGSKLLGWRTIGYVEFEEDCQKVLSQRIRDGIFDEAPIFGDIRSFLSEGYADSYQGMVDVVSGGFPCQDISIVGRGRGIGGERSGLWNEMAEVICCVQPRYVLVENSPALTHRGLGRVLGDLAKMGFDARWGVLSAASYGAPHLRERLWIFADAAGFGRVGLEENEERGRADVHSRAFESWSDLQAHLRIPVGTTFDRPVRGVLRVDDGVAEGMVRLKAIGNGQVPGVVVGAWRELSGQPV